VNGKNGRAMEFSEEFVVLRDVAASLLFTGAIGICCALSQWIVAVGVVLLGLITLQALGRLEASSISGSRPRP
jgi:uncharacterized membrane protein YhiD involved in acid resistance